MQDFGVTNVSCWDSEIASVTSAHRCDCLFSERWGILPSSGATCP